MKVTSCSELRRNLAAALDCVLNDHTRVLITRGRGKPAAVLMSLEDYASWDETNYLLSSPRNAERLLHSVAELEAVESKGRTNQRHLPPTPPRIPTSRA